MTAKPAILLKASPASRGASGELIKLSPRTTGDLSVSVVPSLRVTRIDCGWSASTNCAGVGVPTFHEMAAGFSIDMLLISPKDRLVTRPASRAPNPTPTRLSPRTTEEVKV